MGSGNSLVNFGQLSKAATVLIEKISDAVGGLFKPWQIKRVAKAEVAADIIRAQGQIEVEDLYRRALQRFVDEEAKRQANMEAITAKALPDVKDDSRPQDVEDDWLANFFDKCRIVSDDEMQAIWAKVLAGEVNSPGKFSRRTVNSLGSMDKQDADLFTKLCGFVFHSGEGLLPVIWDVDEDIYKNNGITFSTLNHLDDIGLVKASIGLVGFALHPPSGVAPLSYFGTQVLVDGKISEIERNNVKSVGVGNALLTQVGADLAGIASPEPVEGFLEYAIRRWHEDGYALSSPLPKAGAFESDPIDDHT